MANNRFLSIDWMTAAEKVLRADISPQTTGSTDLSIAMTVENCPEGQTKTLVVETAQGSLKTFRLADPEAVKTEFALSGDYRTYERVFKGQLDPVNAVMNGDLHFSGNVFKAMGLVKSLQPFFTIIARIPTEF